jgi:FKBP-type peptidyl-prolyl cis-trans isomerase
MYDGRFLDGKQFDTNHGKRPYRFVLGAGQVIKGYDLGNYHNYLKKNKIQ